MSVRSTVHQRIEAGLGVELLKSVFVKSKGNLAVADELYSTDYVCHFVVGPE